MTIANRTHAEKLLELYEARIDAALIPNSAKAKTIDVATRDDLIQRAVGQLAGNERMGVFLLNNGLARGGFYDLDCHGPKKVDDPQALALKLVSKLNSVGVPCFVEHTKRAPGARTMFFLREAIPASYIREFMALCGESVGLPSGVEQFPKQDVEGKFGNGLWLPYFGDDVPNALTVVAFNGAILTLEEFLSTAKLNLVSSADLLRALGDLRPKRVRTKAEPSSVPSFSELVQALKSAPGAQTNKRGTEHCCAFHDDATPSAIMFHDTGDYWCSACDHYWRVEEWLDTAQGRSLVGDRVADTVLARIDMDPWEPIVSFGESPVADFPCHTLPTWLRAFTAAVAQETETPPILGAYFALGVLSATAANCIEVEISESWSETTVLFLMSVLDVGHLKSVVARRFIQPLVDYELELNKDKDDEIAKSEAAKEILEERIRHKKNAANKEADPTKQTQSLAEAEALITDLKSYALPTRHQLYVDDVTPEALARCMSRNGGRAAHISAETSLFSLMCGRYDAKGAANAELYLKAHTGESHRVDRLGRDSEFIAQAALTVSVSVQPQVIQDALGQPVLTGRGVLARFLLAKPPSRLGTRTLALRPTDVNLSETYKANVKKLFAGIGHPTGTPTRLTLSPAALDAFQGFRKAIEPRLREDADLCGIRDWASKLAGNVARIAGLLHLAGGVEDVEGALKSPIKAETMEAAILISQCAISHARAVFEELGADPDTDLAKRILRWIASLSLAQFSKRDAFERFKSKRFNRARNLDRSLEILCERGYMRRTDRRPKTVGRTPSPRYAVNPVLQAAATISPKSIRADSIPERKAPRVNVQRYIEHYRRLCERRDAATRVAAASRRIA